MSCSNYNCGYKCNCIGLAIVASIIIGIITGLLQFFAVIAIAPVFLWVTFGIAIVYLAILLIVAATGDTTVKNCIGAIAPALFTGILGTILAALILLAITFAATSALGAIINGALLFFFSLLITSTVCLVKCIVKYDEF